MLAALAIVVGFWVSGRRSFRQAYRAGICTGTHLSTNWAQTHKVKSTNKQLNNPDSQLT